MTTNTPGWEERFEGNLDHSLKLLKRKGQDGWVIAEVDIPKVKAFIAQVEQETLERAAQVAEKPLNFGHTAEAEVIQNYIATMIRALKKEVTHNE